MRRAQRLIALTVLSPFRGCSAAARVASSSFDPSDMLDFLDTKKKLPGERKPVFPDGVPGLEQGVPKELYKGAQQQDDAAAQQQAAVPPPAAPAEEPKAKHGAKGKKAKQAAVTSQDAGAPAATPQDGETAAVEEGAERAPPAPKPKKIARRRTTAPPPDDTGQAQQSGIGAPFPAPMPSGTSRAKFTRFARVKVVCPLSS